MLELPDAPVGLLRLDADGRLIAFNRAARDLLGLPEHASPCSTAECLWGLDATALPGSEGVWSAPGGDPAQRVRYQRDRDGDGWLLSLPHPETAALLRDAAHEHALLGRVGELLAGCDLELGLPDALQSLPAARQLAAGFGNLAEAIRQAVSLSLQIAAEVPHVVSENDELARQSRAQVAALEAVLTATQRLLQGLDSAGEELREVIGIAARADGSAQEGIESARALAASMQLVERRAASADEVIQVIDLVAFQTNILSINARIEAAHAGDAGRGFAVVATEIRQLAERASEASRDVRTLLGQTRSAIGEGVATARRTEQVLDDIGAVLRSVGTAMQSMAGRGTEQGREITAIGGALDDVARLARSNLEHAARVVERSGVLGQATETLHDCVDLFRLPDDPMSEARHTLARELASRAADDIGQALSGALAEGRIGEDALFSREYQPIAGIEPRKYHTAFDALCDELLPPWQEPAAAAQPWIVFAICANPDGYVPTHNLRFSQPLTGDASRDLVGNRTKRIFADRVGRSVGAHVDPYRLQVYRRDTGQIMFDLSVPVFVGGRHWGGFRIGYSLE